MRVQVCIPTEVWERIQAIAHEEHRPPRNQVEHFICKAVSEREMDNQPISKELVHAN
jgi:hypothetical protein